MWSSCFHRNPGNLVPITSESDRWMPLFTSNLDLHRTTWANPHLTWHLTDWKLPRTFSSTAYEALETFRLSRYNNLYEQITMFKDTKDLGQSFPEVTSAPVTWTSLPAAFTSSTSKCTDAGLPRASGGWPRDKAAKWGPLWAKQADNFSITPFKWLKMHFRTFPVFRTLKIFNDEAP